jgi:hypothetical protein
MFLNINRNELLIISCNEYINESIIFYIIL